MTTNEPTDDELRNIAHNATGKGYYSGGVSALRAVWNAARAAAPDHQAEAPSAEDVRDAVDHILGAVEFQDAINSEAVRVLVAAALAARPVVDDATTVQRVAEAIRQRAKWPSMHWPDISGVDHADVVEALARAALGVVFEQTHQSAVSEEER